MANEGNQQLGGQRWPGKTAPGLEGLYGRLRIIVADRPVGTLSRWILTVGGIRPNTLSVDEQAYFRVQFFEAVTTWVWIPMDST